MYISAPHVIPAPVVPAQVEDTENAGETTPDAKTEEQRGWYFSTEQLTFNSHDVTDFSCGLEESIEVVRKAFEELGPFDGILGFSQGAALGSILCDLLEKGGEFHICIMYFLKELFINHLSELSFSFKFAILVSGFRSKLSPHSHYYLTKKKIPTLHVIGDTDRIVEHGRVTYC